MLFRRDNRGGRGERDRQKTIGAERTNRQRETERGEGGGEEEREKRERGRERERERELSSWLLFSCLVVDKMLVF